MTSSIKKSGFTLIETLIAILILTMALAGPMTIVARSLNAALIAKDQTIAFYLAQDAIEYIRYARDTTCLQTTGSCTGNFPPSLSNCTGTQGCYLVDTRADTSVAPACLSAGCPALNYDTVNHYYTTAAAGGTIQSTPFVRSISITAVSTYDYRIQVKVLWKDVSQATRQVVVDESLFLWQ